MSNCKEEYYLVFDGQRLDSKKLIFIMNRQSVVFFRLYDFLSLFVITILLVSEEI